MFRTLLMRRHKSMEEYVRLIPDSLEFPCHETSEELTIESNARWTLGVRYDEHPDEYVRLIPPSLEFEDSESTKELAIESNTNWSLG